MSIEKRTPSPDEVEQAATWGEWSKEPSTFDWTYNGTETCYILEGSATVTPKEGGESVTFNAGDWVVFPDGLECTWEIHETVKKKYSFS